MAVNGGPKIPKDGLVLSLDAANFKSFRGEPTTNEIVAVTWSGDGSNQTSFTKQSVLITDESLKYNGYETFLWSPGTSRNCYLNGADLSTSRTSTVWTFSCYVKRQDGAPITALNVYMYYPSSDGNAAGTIESVGDGWYRISRTRTGADNYLSLVGFTGFTAEYKYYLSAPQLEKKSYPTRAISTNSTRGTTVATGGGWADMTNNENHGELINGASYDSGSLGALSFDGTNDYIDLGSNIVLNNETTFSLWFNSADISQLKYLMCKANNTGYARDFYVAPINGAGISVWFGNSSTEYLSFSSPNGSYTINSWNNLVVTRDGSTCKIYINGIQKASASYSFIQNNNGHSFKIGSLDTASSRYFDGKISNVMVFNRALSETEIKQIYEATRSRYGL